MWLHGSLGWLLVLAWYVCAAPEPEHVAASFAGKTEPEPPVADHDEESAGVGACSQCPVRLLEVVNEEAPDAAQLQLNDAGLRYLESQRSPLFLIPALGVYRGGKSLLLNRLMQRQAPYAQSFGIGHGQETFTRGIEICAEALPNHGGTVVWMDTEGLFSSEDARSAYGPKIFSLALLFSSVVLLNNLKVLNQQFFVFFEEQQQVARILREGLRSEGMRSDLLLPENLPIVWVLQQPINFAASAEASRHQLDSFLTIQDKARERIKDSFKHLIHEVPTATHDARQWSKLDQVSDNQLLLEYVSATKDLRYILLTQLQTARPLQAPSVAAQLRMYVDLVQKDHFSISLAKEAFEDSHVAQLCESFGQNAQDLASGLPAVNLSLAMNMSEQLIQEQRDMIIRDFHLGDAFLRRLQQCLDRKRLELEDMNGELVLEEWQKDVHKVAESGRCFILSKLALELPRYRSKYGPVFSKPLEAKARDFALQVQRSRVAGCVLLRHFAVPVAPWFAWPIMALYIRQGVLSGILTMGVHGVVLAGIYSILQFMGRLPFYVDLDYQVLRQHPGLLEWVMRYPQIPWDLLSQICGILGWIRVAWILGSQMFRPVETRTIGQLSNLELKVNTLLERTEADVKEKIVTSALEAALSIDSNDPAAAALSLVKGLMVVSQVGSSDTHFAYLFEAEHRSLARATVKSFHFPDKDSQSRCAASCKKDSSKLLRLAISNEWDELIPAMVVTLEKLSGRKDVKDGVTSSKPSRRLFQDVEDDEVEEAQEQSCCGCFCRFCIVLLLVLAGFVGAAWLLEFSSRAGLLPTAESTLPNSNAKRCSALNPNCLNMWNTNQWQAAALQLAETGSTSTLSNTVCVSDPDGHWPAVQEKSVKDLEEFGEIARLDASLAVIARCVLVTYFDVRCAQRLMLSSLGRCEPFPPAAHDIRTVRVDLSAFAEKVDHVRGGFNQFGEVAHISASHGYALVEFYDIRAAQTLLAASQGTAVPWTPEQNPSAPGLLASLGSGSGSWPLPSTLPQGLLGYQSEMAEEAADNTDAQTQDVESSKGERGNKPVKTKVSTKEFQKYDIDPDRIQHGEDSRTTVMVRNLVGVSARKDFLMFLEKCGLSDRFTFFYMPCEEQRNVPAGYAFVNFIAPSDVHKVVVMVKSGFWREFMKEPTLKAPAVSYARFQGHEELVKHFSSSAVLHEQDPEKRPIFRPEAAAKAVKEKKLAEAKKDEGSKSKMLLAATQGNTMPWLPEQNSGSAFLTSLGDGSWPLGHAGLGAGGLMGFENALYPIVTEEMVGMAESPQAEEKKTDRANRPLRTKVSTKDFQKFDVDLERIENGEDHRTTVMVRNVAGNNARKEFLNLLEKCGLSDRFTFFYMPCKEHRNVLAGFAFVNFIAPMDVHKLFVMVKNGVWREFMGKSQTKAPGVSYARFQGHEELVEHFSSSAVLHEQDPEKRPIFRPDAAAKAAKEKQKLSKKDSSPLPKVSNGAPGLANLGNNTWMPFLTANELDEASKNIMSTPPAYVKSCLMDAVEAAPRQIGA